MSKNTKLVNKFFKEYCFSNETAACHFLSVESDVLKLYLTGKKSLHKDQIKLIKRSLSGPPYPSEVALLENIIFDLTMMYKFFSSHFDEGSLL